MEGEEGGLSKDKLKKITGTGSSNEVDYKTKAGTAWSHSYLNQKPWHPLSYPNQRRKWIAEQIHSNRQRRAEEVAREYAQEQDFFRQTSLISKKDKDKMETMQAVSFMYVRPPGYNAESARAAELEDQRRTDEEPTMETEAAPVTEDKKKPRPKDVFGRPLPTEEQFEILKNAPRLETGAPARVKPFGVEVRNVKCLRCGNYGHQSGDRECPLKDVIMPNEESRLKRDDPLTAIMAHVDPSEPLKWELKRQPGNFSPPRGGFKPEDPNQQIVAEDIFDEYGGFLGGDNFPELLSNFSSKSKRKSKKKSKHKRHSSPSSRELRVSDEDRSSVPSDDGNKRSRKEKKHKKKKKQSHSVPSSSNDSERDRRKNKHKHSYSSEDSERDRGKNRHKHSYSSEDSKSDRRHRSRRSQQKDSCSSEDEESDECYRSKGSRYKHSYTSEDSDYYRHRRSKKSKQKHSISSQDEADKHHASEKKRSKRCYSSEGCDADRHRRSEKSRQKHSNDTSADESDKHHRSEKSRRRYANGHERSRHWDH